MIRKFERNDLPQVMELWLNSNLQAHDFISTNFWMDHFEMVQNILPDAEIYVDANDDQINGFIGIDNGFIAGLFVAKEMRSNGIGKQLLEKAKELYSELCLAAYEKNTKAVRFYQREQFSIKRKQTDEQTGETELLMQWNQQK